RANTVSPFDLTMDSSRSIVSFAPRGLEKFFKPSTVIVSSPKAVCQIGMRWWRKSSNPGEGSGSMTWTSISLLRHLLRDSTQAETASTHLQTGNSPCERLDEVGQKSVRCPFEG